MVLPSAERFSSLACSVGNRVSLASLIEQTPKQRLLDRHLIYPIQDHHVAKWHAAQCPDSSSRSGGTSVLQRASATGQRG